MFLKKSRLNFLFQLSLISCSSILAACNSHENAEQVKVAPEVAVVTLAARDLHLETELSGRVSAMRIADVRPQVRGIIEKRFFEEGATVKAGEILYQINHASYSAALDQASANVAVANASLTNLRLISERYQKLAQTNNISRHDMEVAQANYQQGRAQLQASEAALKTAQIDLERTKIRAPIAGRIGRSLVTEGALVSAEQETALARIQQWDPVYVDIVQSSQQITQLKRNLAVRTPSANLSASQSQVSLLLEDGQIYEQRGTLKFTDINVDPETGMVNLRAQFPNPDGILLPGMFVRTQVEQGTTAQVLLVPQQAVSYNEKNQPVVWVVNAQQIAEQRTLQLLGQRDNQWIVRERLPLHESGLVSGDRVIVEGSLRVSPGLKVTTVDWVSPATALVRAD